MDNFTKNTIDINTSGGYTYEQVLNNKNCSKNPKYWYLIENSIGKEERYLFKSPVAESWEFFDPNIENPIRHTNQVYLRFLDVKGFIEPSNYYRLNGVYTKTSLDTLAWNRFWDDMEDKIYNGFELEGVRITGRHFFLINFGRFKAIPVDVDGNPTSTNKVWSFLNFVDHQYYMMHELEECLLEGKFKKFKDYNKWFPLKDKDDFESLKLQNFATSKGRRKGWTAAIGIGILEYNFTFIESSMNIIAAYEKIKYGPILRAVHDTKSFLDVNTPWIRRTEIKGTYDEFTAGVEVVDEYGIKTKVGYKSTVNAISFKDNRFKAVGDSADVINIEEAGVFHDLIETYQVSMEPLIRNGETMIGMCIVGGTAGDMESGASEGLADIMHNPKAYGFKRFQNIYEQQDLNEEAGWFIDDLWYLPVSRKKEFFLKLDSSDRLKHILDQFEGNSVNTIDKQGNSYRYLANIVLEDKRLGRRKTSSIAYQKFITQQPKYLSEAFLLNESSPFDTATAKEALGQLSVEKIGPKKGVFSILESKPRFRLNMNLVAVDHFPFKHPDPTGCWVIYEDPVTRDGEVPYGRYIAGNDPIDWGSDEVSSNGDHSFAATYIINTLTRNIAAEYVGRPRKAEDYFEQLWRGLEWYNATLLYENNLKSLFSYFKQKNKLSLLAREPDSLRSMIGYKANNRTLGFHATATSNNHARELIHTWTLEDVVTGQKEDGEVVFTPRMYFIQSRILLQQIIGWNSKGNFDCISGLGAAMILLFDRDYGEDEDVKTESMFDTGIFYALKQTLNPKKINKLNFR